MLNDDFRTLIDKFNIISSKGWIKAINKSLGAIGLTFEHELNKEPDTDFFPDYNSVEIKCLGRYSRYPIALFACSFDGPGENEISRLAQSYGYYDSTFTDKKILYTPLRFGEYSIVKDSYAFRLQFEDDKIFLCVYDCDYHLIEKKAYVSINTLYVHFMIKLQNLALVRASKKMIDDIKYFRYYRISLYKLISFDKFIDLLKNDIITVNLVCRLSKCGYKVGRYSNQSLVFHIKPCDLTKLYNLIYSCENGVSNISEE